MIRILDTLKHSHNRVMMAPGFFVVNDMKRSMRGKSGLQENSLVAPKSKILNLH